MARPVYGRRVNTPGPRIDLNLLRTFLAVYRAGSITAAAPLLGLSQPTVTAQVRALESETGRELFTRLPRGVEPTPYAHELAGRVAVPLDALTSATGDGGDQAAPVHLAGPAELLSLRVLPALGPVIADGVRVRITPGLTDALLDELRAGRHDLLIATRRPSGRTLPFTALMTEDYVLVAAPSWAARLSAATPPDPVPAKGRPPAAANEVPVGERPPIPADLVQAEERPPAPPDFVPAEEPRPAARADVPSRLAGVPLSAYAEDLPIARRYWRTVFGRRLSVEAAVTVPDLRGVLAAVVAGAGYSVLPRYLCAGDLAAGRLVLLHEPANRPGNTVYLVQRPGTEVNPNVQRVRDHLRRAATGW